MRAGRDFTDDVSVPNEPLQLVAEEAAMKPVRTTLICALTSVLVGAVAVQATAQTPQKAPPTPAQALVATFSSLNQRILAMAEDWPEAKYGFRLDEKANPPVRTFGEVLVHIMAGNIYAAKRGRGETASWDEVDPKTLNGKAAIVAAYRKSMEDAIASLKAIPPERFHTTLAPWLSVIEHDAEHYGQLIAYYRANGAVPPSSRKGSQ
jgi:uncharacterized damage-inducible protein DinB